MGRALGHLTDSRQPARSCLCATRGDDGSRGDRFGDSSHFRDIAGHSQEMRQTGQPMEDSRDPDIRAHGRRKIAPMLTLNRHHLRRNRRPKDSFRYIASLVRSYLQVFTIECGANLLACAENLGRTYGRPVATHRALTMSEASRHRVYFLALLKIAYK